MARPKKAKPIPPAVLEWLRQEGARGGRMGAAKRWKDVPAAVRSEGARKAARARWAKAKARKSVWITLALAATLFPRAAPAGQGWYLLEPPIRSHVVLAAPLHMWTHVSAFDTAKDCEASLGERGTRAAQDSHDPSQQFRRAAIEAAVAGRCIASDDPRLKP
jgi:hypothetical protein